MRPLGKPRQRENHRYRGRCEEGKASDLWGAPNSGRFFGGRHFLFGTSYKDDEAIPSPPELFKAHDGTLTDGCIAIFSSSAKM